VFAISWAWASYSWFASAFDDDGWFAAWPPVLLGLRDIVIFGSLPAMGAGLYVAAYHLEHHTEIGAVGTVLSVAIPLAAFVLMLYALWRALMRWQDPFHLGLLPGTTAVLFRGRVGRGWGLDGMVPGRAGAGAGGHGHRIRDAGTRWQEVLLIRMMQPG
jgi:hypothetical protein